MTAVSPIIREGLPGGSFTPCLPSRWSLDQETLKMCWGMLLSQASGLDSTTCGLEHLEASTLGEPSPTWLWSEGLEPHNCQIAKAPTDVRRQVMAGP